MAGSTCHAGSPFLGFGTPQLDSTLAAGLKVRTVFAPIVYSNAPIGTVLNPQAPRDTGTPALGYHYDPLDYALSGATTTPGTAYTVGPGTAVGWFRPVGGSYPNYALLLGSSVTANFNGTAEAPCYWVRCNTVQEQDLGGATGPGAIQSRTYNYSGTAPILNARFLRLSILTTAQDTYFRDYNAVLTENLTSCEFWTGVFGGYNIIGNYTNCLFDRISFWHTTGDTTYPSVIFRNCTWHCGAFGVQYRAGQPYWTTSVRDCVFDATAVSGTDNGNWDFDYNAFFPGTTNRPTIVRGAHDYVSGPGFNWQAGPLGNYYIPAGSLEIDAGSRTASAAGLFHYTTQTNQTKRQPRRSILDIITLL